MQVLIDCICIGELKGLIIEGEPTEELLQETFDNLYIEYCDLIGNNKNLRLIKDIKYLEAKLDICNLCIYNLKLAYSPECVKILYDYGYRRKFNPEDPESYTADIKMLETQMGNVRMAIKRARQYYEMSKPELTAKPTEKDFHKTLAAINIHFKTSFDMRQITAYDFAMYYSLFQQDNNGR